MKTAIAVLCALALSAPAFGEISATATITSQQVGSSYEYDLTLHNTGTTDIGTFWFAWVPGLDFLPSVPSAETSPDSWYPYVSGGAFAGDGYSIQWYAYGSALAAGDSLSGFSFTTTDAPSVIGGTSPIFSPFYQTRTSFVYIGAPEGDPGSQFLATVVTTPEPASLSLLSVGVGALTLRRRGKR